MWFASDGACRLSICILFSFALEFVSIAPNDAQLGVNLALLVNAAQTAVLGSLFAKAICCHKANRCVTLLLEVALASGIIFLCDIALPFFVPVCRRFEVVLLLSLRVLLPASIKLRFIFA